MGDVFFINMDCEKIIQLIKSLKEKGFEMILSIHSDGVLYDVWHEPEKDDEKEPPPR